MRNFVLVALAVVLLGGAAVAAFVYPEAVVSLANSSFFGCSTSGCCSSCDACGGQEE